MTPEIKALLARLLTMYSHRGDGIPTQYVNPDGPQAVALIREQASEIERLRESLRKCRRAISGGRPEPRREVREIVDEAIEEHDRALARKALGEQP